MMHKTCSINYGHLADLQKTLPITDLNKKNFHLIKYLLATFIFFSFFSICTCAVLDLAGAARFYQGIVSQMFCELSKQICVSPKSYFFWEFQAETLYMCPKQRCPKHLCFGHTHKVSAWYSHPKCDFWHCIFSRYHIRELAKH